MAKYTGIEKYIFSDVYNFFLKYSEIPNQDEYWEQCVRDAKLLTFKYHEYPLAKHMVINTMEQLEFKICGRPLDGYTYEQWNAILGDYQNMKPFH
jgi:hypothetical protein